MEQHDSYDMLAPDWLFSQEAAMTVTASYLLLVKILLPRFMKEKKPFSLKGVIALYNLAQVVMNVHIVYKCFSLMGVNLIFMLKNTCNPVSAVNSSPDVGKQIFKIILYYYFNKIIDLFDTICFSLRKKESQISFLHVSHHVIAVWLSWVSLVPMREELCVQFIALNSGVHIVMYIYYFLSGLGAWVQKYLWWKKYLTAGQMVQFLMGLATTAKVKMEGCSCHPWFIFTWASVSAYFMIMFLNFYRQSYLIMKKQK